jgi:hypothetical protein
MTNQFRVIHDDRPISWYTDRGELRADAVAGPSNAGLNGSARARGSSATRARPRTETIDQEGERWWFKFLLDVPDETG